MAAKDVKFSVDARDRMLRGVGHVPMFDNPQLIAKVLLEGSAPVGTVSPLEPPVRRRTPRAATA